jgi:hypothetical protein
MAAPSWATNIIKAGKPPTDVDSFTVSQDGQELFVEI